VYLGVGPEQNFTYIVNLEPRLAVIFDIRRQNAMLHLMYKALFELSPSRAEFVSRLFSRPLRRAPRDDSHAGDIFAAVSTTVVSDSAFDAELEGDRRPLTVSPVPDVGRRHRLDAARLRGFSRSRSGHQLTRFG
jgi:hypothetical protein